MFENNYSLENAINSIKNSDIISLQNNLSKGDFYINDENEFGETLLGVAIWLDKYEIVKYLCEQKNIDVNKKSSVKIDQNGTKLRIRPLEMIAFIKPFKDKTLDLKLSKKSKEIISLLMEKGAKIPVERYVNKKIFANRVKELATIVSELGISQE